MSPYFLFGIVLLIGIVLLVRWYTSADPKALARIVKWALLTLAVLIILYLAVRWGPAALGGLAVLIPFVFKWGSLIRRLKGMAGGMSGGISGGMSGGMAGSPPGQTSRVETRMLAMTLNHDSGELSGVVVDGGFKGRSLQSLSLAELLALRDECRAQDPQSLPVLEAYLDRNHGTGWRKDAAGGSATGESGDTSTAAMSRADALEILGLEEGANAEEIRAAHHRLMVRLHPDQGGTNWLAARINRARDVLLGS